MADTYRPYFKKSKFPFEMKKRFEISNFSNSRRNSATHIVQTRILNTFIAAINDNGGLPNFVVFMLDDEIMNFIEYSGYGVSTMYRSLLELLVKKVNCVINDAKSQLP